MTPGQWRPVKGLSPWKVLKSVRRGWPGALLMVALFVPVFWAAWHQPGVYTVAASVVLSPPSGVPALVPDSGRAIGWAVALEAEVAHGASGHPAVAPRTLLVDRGLRQGVSVELSDWGGQWASDIREAAFFVQAVGPDRQVVHEQFWAEVDSIEQVVLQRQVELGVGAENRISVTLVPSVVEVVYRPPDRVRAVAALLPVAGISIAAATLLTARLVARRRRRALAAAASGAGTSAG
ncbi:MAG: hypothetical protein ACK5KO_04445 [Arachnia sp.]